MYFTLSVLLVVLTLADMLHSTALGLFFMNLFLY